MKIKKTFVATIATLLLLAFPATALAAPSTSSPLISTSAPAATNTVYLSLLSSSGSAALTTSTTSTSSSSATSLLSSTQTGTQKLLRDKVFLNLDKSYLIVSKEYPIQVEAVISGWLPDPCHILKTATKASIIDNIINIEVYSLYDPTQACITVLQPFTTKVPLGTFGKGAFVVMVNGEKLGSFGSGVTASFSASTSILSSTTTINKPTTNSVGVR